MVHVVDAPVERLGARMPERPVWVCSVRSDLTWAQVGRRVVVTTGVAPDACRLDVVRNQSRLVHVVAILVRENGGVHHAYRDAFQLQTECHRIACELGHLPRPHAQHPAPRRPTCLPPCITINIEPSGSVSAKDASDDLSATLLKHAGLQQF